MTLHREGRGTILTVTLLVAFINGLTFTCVTTPWISFLVAAVSLLFWIFILSFFRIPSRKLTIQDNAIIAPADGEVVVIEEVQADEYFTDRRIQVSIFMSPFNVHVNRNPVSGEVVYSQYHPGKYLVAWHPKSSTDNERSTCVVKHASGTEVLFRQIAGALARRICYYAQIGDNAQTGAEFGFIKFGSRVDLFLPLGTKIDVVLNQKVKAKLTKLGSLN